MVQLVVANYNLSITTSPTAIKPEAQYDFIHALRFRSPRPLNKTEIQYFRANAKSFAIRESHPIRGLGNRVMTFVLPNESALKLLANIDGVHVNYVEIARDLILSSEQEAQAVNQLFDEHFVQPWHGKRDTKISHDTITYSGQRKRGSYNHFAWYSDRPAKLTGEWPCFHIEGRYQGANAVRKAGVNHPHDLLMVDFAAYWRKHLRLYRVNRERLGRHYRNRRSGRRERQATIDQFGPISYNRDYATGCVLYRNFACHPKQQRYSVQRFVDRFGRGPFLEDSIVIYGDETKFALIHPQLRMTSANVDLLRTTSSISTPPANDFLHPYPTNPSDCDQSTKEISTTAVVADNPRKATDDAIQLQRD